MNADELSKVASGLEWVADRLQDLPENRIDGEIASLHCRAAGFIVAELVKNLNDGLEPTEALRRAATGELLIDTTTRTVSRVPSVT
jgi:hypothetical protein